MSSSASIPARRARLFASSIIASAVAGVAAALVPAAAEAAGACPDTATAVCTGPSTGDTLNDKAYASVQLGTPATAYAATGPVDIAPNDAADLTVGLASGSSIDTSASSGVTALTIANVANGGGAVTVDNDGAIHADGASSIALFVDNAGAGHPIALNNTGIISGSVYAALISADGGSDVTVNSTGALLSSAGDALNVTTTGDVAVGSAASRITTGATTATGITAAGRAISVSGDIDSQMSVYLGAGTVTGGGNAAIFVDNVTSIGAGGTGSGLVDLEGTTVNAATGYGVQVSEYDGDAATVRVGVGGAATVINSGSYGINASSTGSGGDVTVALGSAAVLNATAIGIDANGYGTTGGDVTVTTAAGSIIDAQAGASLDAGISAVSGNGGDVTVNAQGQIGSTSDGVTLTGISATTSGAGTVDVTAGGAIYSDSVGIAATSDDGKVSVTLVEGAVVVGASTGAYATANGLGDASITLGKGAQVTSGGPAGLGVELTASSGHITGTIGEDAQVTSGYIGVYASGGSTVDITAAAGSRISGTLAGVYANSAGAISLSTAAGSDVEAGTYGVYAYSTGGSAQVTIDGSIGAGTAGGYGALAAVTTGAGDASVTAGAGSSIHATTRGVSVTNAGSGRAMATVSGAVDGGNGFGVYAGTTGAGETDVTVTRTGAVTAAGGVGLRAVNAGSGAVKIEADGTVSAVTGILAQTTGSATTSITVGGSVTATGIGVSSQSGGNAQITVATGGSVRGLGDAAHAVLSVGQGAGATTTVTLASGSSVASSAGAAAAAGLVLASTGATGQVAIANSGALTGRIDLSSLTDPAGVTRFANAGTWTTSGTSTFSAGNPAGNALANTGVLVSKGTTTLANLATLTNSGVVDLRSGGVGLLTLSGAYVGAGGTVVTNANLGGAGSTADVLKAASTAGTGAIYVQDTATGHGGYVPTGQGITLVSTTGTSGLAFALDSRSSGYTTAYGAPALQKDIWLYTLTNGANGAALVSTPGPQAYRFAATLTGAQTLWNMAPGWQDRTQLAAAPGGKAEDGDARPGVWLKAIGDWATRNRHVAVNGVAFNAGYAQNTGGLEGGVDIGKAGVARSGDQALVGVEAAYLDSTLEFRDTAARGHFEGYSVGVYGAYRTGMLFASAEVKGDILTLTQSAPDLGYSQKGDVRTWGGRVEAGAALPFGPGEVQPLASLSYATTSVDDFLVGGTTAHATDASTFRGSLGVRYAAVLEANDRYVLRANGEARAWDEFDGRNTLALIGSGPSLPIVDDLHGVFGEVGVGLDVTSRDGRTAGFLNASVKAKDGYTDARLGLGFRYAFGGGK